ncbi:hypothetical protein A3D00_01810 [Candidatus Woesebacteria bacterium RIFCSPHIGHO2_02_FULL_38_9]|uniref:FCP1 homology domain-containing protein n=1 Tax=Candidatus Woesebacteria bacterium RIFCSPHIGHO2_01_FULL_39_28 TaxID=1802496 RepID=A0A1F7YHP7_9BACT|nr:MAG: hypothetical protein A2627_03645 [Candidatus Woesebacteria bacterium RIFCSPHIGHO2_01_FULL_39_28]OGM33663.1 MAG: hypothetical protein A3D00_01810 [Candidatus Woesebacteria bacterium RIFCSPHIGHO2_02_FULL_38_9]OGM58516.1 MAG: hypothetical protein A3A50_00655 [Candidatus Woesebacteria bacterium RIFCSPLOWO2_01_FULL_38_20]
MLFSGVIFDLDGTVLDDEGQYEMAFKKVLKSLGVKPEPNFPHVPGIGVRENWPRFLSHYKIRTKKSVDELAGETQIAYFQEFSEVELNPGFLELVQKVRNHGIKTALATSNSSMMLERINFKFHLERYFDAMVTREEVYQSKPFPEIFIKTSTKLNLPPSECLVIEDAKAGVDAAHAAGMKVIGLARDKTHAKTLKGADKIIFSFIDLLKGSAFGVL